MSRKKRKRRPSGAGVDRAAPGAPEAAPGEAAPGEAGPGEGPGGYATIRSGAAARRAGRPGEREARKPRRPAPARPSGGRFSQALRAESPYPPLLVSLGRALAAVSAPPVLALSLVVVPALWFALLPLGLDHFPSGMVDLLAVPPISSLFDLRLGATLYGLTTGTLVFLAGATVVRSVIWSLLGGMVVEALEYGSVSLVGVLRGLRAFRAVLLANALNASMILVGNLILPAFLGASIGYLVFTAALVGGLYFLSFTPAVAAREDRPAREAVRRSVRAALLPGSRHLVLVFVYFLLSVSGFVRLSPGGAFFTANPGVASWVLTLAGTVLHVGFLGAFAYRWMAVEDQVSNEPLRFRRKAPPPRRPSRSRTR